MTAQIGDLLIYKGKNYSISSEPNILPCKHKKYDISFTWGSTACWRGYIATWKVSRNKLYLTDVSGSGVVTDIIKYREEKLRLRKLLREGVINSSENGRMLKEAYKKLTEEKEIDMQLLHETDKPVFAHWISGEIRVPIGKILNYVHMGYASVFEEDLLLEFSNGILTGTRIVKNEKRKT